MMREKDAFDASMNASIAVISLVDASANLEMLLLNIRHRFKSLRDERPD
jgi:hypothetical protein